MNSSGIIKNRYDKYILILFPVVFIAVSVMLFWKCRFGFPFEESFYLNSAYRFVRGDIPLIHEWHLSQISFIYLKPFVWAYLQIQGSTEGIALFMRFVFTAVWIIFSLFLFIRIRKASLTAAAAVSLTMLVYTPAGQMALYYNSIGIMMLLSSCVIVASATRFKPLQYVIAGFLYAVAVTCCPFLAVIFVIFSIAGIRGLIKKTGTGKTWLWTMIGIVICFILFCIYFLCMASIGDYLDMLPHIFSDGEHDWNIMVKIAGYIMGFIEVAIPCGIIVALMMINVILAAVKKEKYNRTAGFIAACILTVLFQLSIMFFNNLINFYMIAPAMLGLYCRVTDADETNRKIFSYVWIPGMIYSFCLHMSSNMGFVAIASAASVASAASLVMAVRTALSLRGDHPQTGKITAAALAAVLFLQFGLVAWQRYIYVFGATDIKYTTEYLDSGIAKGLYETPEWRDIYVSKCREINDIKNDPDVGSILVVSSEWWMYLEAQKDIACYTTWTPNLDPKQLEDYYSLYPDKRPDAVYIDKIYTDLAPYFVNMGYTGSLTPEGGYILYPST